MTDVIEAAENETRSQFLTFRIEEEVFGVPIETVREVVDYEPVTRVPGAAEFLSGIINLRGAVVAVADIRNKCGLPPITETENTCIIVLRFETTSEEEVTVGIIADEVLGVMEVSSSNLREHPDLGTGIPSEYLCGLGKIDDQFFLLLDVAKVIESSL